MRKRPTLWTSLLIVIIFVLGACSNGKMSEELSGIEKQVEDLFVDGDKSDIQAFSQEDIEKLDELLNTLQQEKLSSSNEKRLENVKRYINQAVEMDKVQTDILALMDNKDVIKEDFQIQNIDALQKVLHAYKKESKSFYDRNEEKLKSAKQQAKEINETKTQIDKLFHDKKVKKDVTNKDEKKTNKMIAKIKNENIQKDFSEKMKKVSKFLSAKKDKDEKKKKNKKTKVSVSKENGTYYVSGTSSLNVRSGNTTNDSVLGSLKENDKVKVTGKASNGWYQFDYNGKKGFVSGNYLSDKKQESIASASEKESSDQSPKEESKKQEGDQNIVDKMSNLGNSGQVILVTTKGYNTNTGQVRTYEKDGNGKWHKEKDVTAHIGKNGFADNKVEGDGKSPTGKYSIGSAFGTSGNPGTKLNYKPATADDVWVDDSSSKHYNTWQSKSSGDKDWDSAEDMTHPLYSNGFVINYNTTQTPDKGSAIFMHTGDSYTVGCTAVPEGQLIDIMQWIDPNKNPVIIQTPESGLGNY